MKVVFDWWIMFGMMFGWRNFVVWWRFEWDMKVGSFVVMEVLESGLRDGRCWYWRMMEEEGKKIRYMKARGWALPCHYRHGPCQLTENWGLARHGVARACHCRHGRCQASGPLGSKVFFLCFLESCSDNYLQNNLKQTKTIKCVGCLARSARLKSLAWRLESVLRKDQRDHIV